MILCYGSPSGKGPTCQCRRHKRCGFDPGLGRSLGGRHGYPLPFSCLENPTDTETWQASVHMVAKSWTQLKWLSTYIIWMETEYLSKFLFSANFYFEHSQIYRKILITQWIHKFFHLNSPTIYPLPILFILLYSKDLTSPIGSTGGSDGKESACNTGDLGLIPGFGRSPGKGNGNPLQYFCLENPMDRGAWWTTFHRVTRSQTRLKQL